MPRQISLTKVPTFITAKDKKSLVGSMIKNNIKFNKEFQYFDIQQNGSEWIAWFYFDFNKEAMKGEY